MDDRQAGQVLSDLEGLLEVERRVIREGRFDSLGIVVAEKTRLVGLLERPDAPGAGAKLARLNRTAEANGHLLSAALRGVRSATRRLDMIRRAGSSLSTYDSLGRASTIDLHPREVEKRA